MSNATLSPDHTIARDDAQHLLAAVAAGNDGAMAAIWAAYAGPVRGLARSLSKAAAIDADDIVQETMTRVWRAAATFDPRRGTETTFVFTIARRVVIDRWRKTTVRPIEQALDDRFPLVDVRGTGAEERAVLRGSIVAAVASLSPLQREVIEFAYFHGFSQSEIADRLGVPLGTVKTRTFAALRALRPLLADRDHHAR